MHEFNNRIEAQRHVLEVVNGNAWQREELCGLSNKAIDRWVKVNMIETQSRLVELLMAVADELFFLANKSQEQVTEEYARRSQRVSALTVEIESELNVLARR